MALARFRVTGQLDSIGRFQAGTVTIDRASGIISVRPLRRHRVYELPLSDVAQMICQRVILAERREKQAAKRAKKVRRGG